MKLNHDYVRDILLYIEENLYYEDSQSATPNKHQEISDGQLLCDDYFKNHNKQELAYALELLLQEGFIACAERPYFVKGNLQIARIIGLTWSGHTLLDNIRNDTVWNAVKQKSKRIGGVSIIALANAAGALANAMMTDPNALNNFIQGINNVGNMVFH